MASYFERLPDLKIKNQSLADQIDLARSTNSNGFNLYANLALNYLEEAAKENHAESLDLLGMLYATGEFLEKDPKRAVGLFKRAAQLGLTEAKFHLAMALKEGFGANQNPTEAFAWLRIASKENLSEAIFALAECYEEGFGTEKNPELAAGYFLQAAEKGDANAIKKLITSALADPEHQNIHKIFQTIEKGANADIAECLVALGKALLALNSQKSHKGLELLEKAAELGSGSAFNALCRYFESKSDMVSAIVYAHLAKINGQWQADRYLQYLRDKASDEDLMRAAEIASFPSVKLTVNELKQRRQSC